VAWGIIGVILAVIQRRRGEAPTLDLEDELAEPRLNVAEVPTAKPI
jgi:hypothetical protein